MYGFISLANTAMRRFMGLAALLLLAARAQAQDTTVVVRHLAPQQDTGVTVRHIDPLAVAPAPPAYGAPRYALRRAVVFKDPNVATSLSFIFPGGGQYYSGRPGKGLAITAFAIGAPIIGFAEANSEPSYNCSRTPLGSPYLCGGRRDFPPAAIGLGVGITAWLYGIATAGSDAQRWNRAHGVRFVNEPGRIGFAVAVP